MNLGAIIAFLKGALSGGSGASVGPSSSRLLFAIVVVASVGWLTGDLIFQGISANWVAAFTALLGAAATGYVGGKFADKPPAS